MKIVIDIDEDIYNRFTHNEVKPRCEITEKERFQMGADAIRLTRAFCNGTPLSKGHGRLIDADKLKEVYENTEDAEYCQWTLYGVTSEIDDAETIIEAESEG